MLRLALLVCFVAAAAAVPALQSDTEFCNGQTTCPPDCGYVSRNEKCVFCRCGDSPLVQPLPLPEPEPQCEHGPGFIDECDNDCKCVKGGRYGCTRKLCMPGQTPEKPKTCSGADNLPKRANQRVFCHEGIIKVQSLEDKCLPGATFKDTEDCNTCRCSDTGAAGCTLKLCLPKQDTGCQHGPHFIDECDNDCNCGKDGKYGCTRKLCMPGETPEKPKTCSGADNLPKRANQRVFCHEGIVKVQEPSAKCLPGATFKDAEDCNTCRCSDTGAAGCTLKLCLPKQDTGCQHGPHFIDECDNDCNCGKDGKYGCTRKLCMPGQTPEKPKTCSGADNLPKRANQRVFCHEGIVKVQEPSAKCLPGATFKDAEDCNTCRCSDTGAAGCTLKLCLPKQVSATGCPYGPGFIDECNNDCSCVDGRFYGCTKKACKPGDQAEVPMKCTSSDNLPPRDGQHVFCDEGVVKLQKKETGCEHGPGFIDECNNDCSCVGGRSYGCTRKACKPGEKAEVPMKCSSSDNLPSRAGVHVFCDEGIIKLQKPVCPYGEEFIDECGNDCRCLENGYACTLKSCAPVQIGMKPMACEGSADLPERKGRRVFCHEGIVKVQEEDAACLPGSSFAVECNTCFCTAGGKSGCTIKACLGEASESTVTCKSGAPQCPQDCGQVYNPGRDCYDCSCAVGQPGDVVAQFGQDCPPGTVVSDSGAFFKTCGPSNKCPYGLEFIDQCDNDCRCAAGGYGCSRKACRPGQTAEEPLTCEGSAQLPDRTGKRVFCHEGVVKVQDKSDRCIPGSVFKDDCNSCFCGEDGDEGCTLKLCPAKKPDNCEHGPSFIDECDNDCMCVNNESYACSRKACRPGQTTKKPLSCDGAAYLPERSGMRVMCHEGIVKTQREDEKCLPGSVYKVDCNTCTCSGGCTLKGCI